MVNQMKTQDICCEYTLREMSAKPLSKRESWSSRSVPIRSTSAQRLPATHKMGVFIGKKMAGDRAWGCMMSSMLPSDGDLGILWEHGLTSGQTMYPLFLKRYGHNQLFVIGLGWKGHYAQSDTIYWMNLRQPKPRNSWTVTHVWQVPLQWSLGWTSLNMLGGGTDSNSCTNGPELGPCIERCWDKGVQGGQGPVQGSPSFLNRQNDRHDWKHYLPTTSLAGGNNESALSLFDGRRCTCSLHFRMRFLTLGIVLPILVLSTLTYCLSISSHKHIQKSTNIWILCVVSGHQGTYPSYAILIPKLEGYIVNL